MLKNSYGANLGSIAGVYKYVDFVAASLTYRWRMGPT